MKQHVLAVIDLYQMKYLAPDLEPHGRSRGVGASDLIKSPTDH